MDYVKGLINAKVNPRNISKLLVTKTGKDYTYKDVVNLMSRLKRDEVACPVETVLGKILEEGGTVNYNKAEGSNNVDVLWIQTKDMLDHLIKCEPLVFQCDTTFGTSTEGYKLYVPVYYSNITAKWEIAALLFMSTETKKNIETGINYFKSSLPYNFEPSKMIFFCDKDFEYIDVSILISQISVNNTGQH